MTDRNCCYVIGGFSRSRSQSSSRYTRVSSGASIASLIWLVRMSTTVMRMSSLMLVRVSGSEG
jgi:hypothetical protein